MSYEKFKWIKWWWKEWSTNSSSEQRNSKNVIDIKQQDLTDFDFSNGEVSEWIMVSAAQKKREEGEGENQKKCRPTKGGLVMWWWVLLLF